MTRCAQTELTISFPNKTTKLEIIRNFGNSRLRGRKALLDISLGVPEFDDRYSIYGNHQKDANQLLSSAVQWKIEQLCQLVPGDAIYVSILKKQVKIVCPVFIKGVQPLDDFVRLGLELFDQLKLTLSEGISFQQDDIANTVESLQCPVCSSNVEGVMVMCVRCKTPHCLDCWQYNGKCGMFACGENRYVMVGGEPHAETS